jgi:RNA polymerase sigma-70 factor (ECF subfamily)
VIDLVDEIVDGAGPSTRATFETAFAQAWADRDPEAGAALDRLATSAARSPHALDLLLTLAYDHRLARSAIRRVLIAEQDVEEAEHAALAVIALRVDDFRGDASFTTWLHRVAANEAKMLVRARSRRLPVASREHDERGYLARLSTLVGNRDVVQRVLDSLPDHYRQVLVLREIDGLGYDEIAAQLDVPVGTVRSRLSKARALAASRVRD